MMASPIGVIGGSGLYDLDGLENLSEVEVETPFGPPSDTFRRGEIAGRTVIFLARHARGHRILPTELNHRANLWAMRSLGVRFLICVTAVGSLREELAPGDIVLPNQFLDRTSQRAKSTFFGDGIVAHVSAADPYSSNLRKLLEKAILEESETESSVRNGGTYVQMDGPAFSSRAESELHRQLGGDIIGMTNIPEVKLSLEAGIAVATICMVTDYDAWRPEEVAVNTVSVLEVLQNNAEKAKKILLRAVPTIPETPEWPEHGLLRMAMATPRELWPEETTAKLRPILHEFL